MCKYCTEYGMESCTKCGCLVCLDDVMVGDDIVRPMCIGDYGDVLCDYCYHAELFRGDYDEDEQYQEATADD